MISKIIIEDKKTLDIVEKLRILRSQFLDKIEKDICRHGNALVTSTGKSKPIRIVHLEHIEHFVDEDTGEVVDVIRACLVRKGDLMYLNGKKLNVNKYLFG